MFQFVETIRSIDGQLQNLAAHQLRMETTCRHFFPNLKVPVLQHILSSHRLAPGLQKCRVVYGATGIVVVESQDYAPRTIDSLRLVTDDTIDYPYKSTDRSALEKLSALRGVCDDIVIVRHGLLTDTSYSNIALFDGSRWYTPRTPLLEGTMRHRLLKEGRLAECDIRPSDLPRYKCLSLINAMLELGDVVVDRHHIVND